jgi:hypothetical protein
MRYLLLLILILVSWTLMAQLKPVVNSSVTYIDTVGIEDLKFNAAKKKVEDHANQSMPRYKWLMKRIHYYDSLSANSKSPVKMKLYSDSAKMFLKSRETLRNQINGEVLKLYNK